MAERGREGGVGAPPNGDPVARPLSGAYVLSWIGAYVLSWVAGGSGGQAASGSLSIVLAMSVAQLLRAQRGHKLEAANDFLL